MPLPRRWAVAELIETSQGTTWIKYFMNVSIGTVK